MHRARNAYIYIYMYAYIYIHIYIYIYMYIGMSRPVYIIYIYVCVWVLQYHYVYIYNMLVLERFSSGRVQLWSRVLGYLEFEGYLATNGPGFPHDPTP